MVGDDVGDESAFLAAERLGGLALRVAGEHFRRGVDSAALRVCAWLQGRSPRRLRKTAACA